MERTLSVKGSVFSHLPSTMGTPCVGEITIPRSFAPLGSRGRRGLSFRTRRLRFNCRASSRMEEDWISSPTASPYQILGIDPMSCSPSQLKAAFRARVCKFCEPLWWFLTCFCGVWSLDRFCAPFVWIRGDLFIYLFFLNILIKVSLLVVLKR